VRGAEGEEEAGPPLSRESSSPSDPTLSRALSLSNK